MWRGDAIYFNSDREHGTLNIYKYDVSSGKITPMTSYKNYDVKCPSIRQVSYDDSRLHQSVVATAGLLFPEHASGAAHVDLVFLLLLDHRRGSRGGGVPATTAAGGGREGARVGKDSLRHSEQ